MDTKNFPNRAIQEPETEKVSVELRMALMSLS